MVFLNRLLRLRPTLQRQFQKAPMAQGPLKCPTEMDGILHKNLVVFLQTFGSTFMFLTTFFLYYRYNRAERKGEFYKYVDLKEINDYMMHKYGVFSKDHTEWQKANIKKAAEKAAGGDEEEEDDE